MTNSWGPRGPAVVGDHHYLVRFDKLIGFADGPKWPGALTVVAIADVVGKAAPSPVATISGALSRWCKIALAASKGTYARWLTNNTALFGNHIALSTRGSIERKFQMSFSKQNRPRVSKNVIGNMITWNAKKRTDWFSGDGLIENDRYTATRRCPACLQPRTIEGHDPCLGTLPGVNFACCGHGVHRGYISFTNGMIIRGKFNVVERKQGKDFSPVIQLPEGYD